MVRLFISYSHKDEELRKELETHLALLKRQGVISSWDDRRITAGSDLNEAISSVLESSQIILLLVSARFLDSDYCYEKEMKRALEKHEDGSAVVIPVILHPCDWVSAPFRHLRATPTDGKPVSMHANQHEAFAIVAKDVREAAMSVPAAESALKGKKDTRPLSASSLTMSIKEICDVLALGLRAEGVEVLQVRLVNNNTFLVEFVAKSQGSVDVKSEISFAIAYLSGFFRDWPNTPASIANLGAQAFTEGGKSLVHAISSLKAAEHISQGRPIEWLQDTIFQDHTDEYRSGIAKQRIGQLENGLRLLVCRVLEEAEGADWWNARVGSKVRRKTEDMYEGQEGVRSDNGNTLIYFTFILDLRRIVVSNWSEFEHVFTDQKHFSDLLAEFNVIRRGEAHNRVLKDDEFEKLEDIYAERMGQIAKTAPEAATNFLVENWRIQLRDIFSAAVESKVVLQTGCSVAVAVKGMNKQIHWFEDIEQRVSSVVVPPTKRGLHDELLTLIGNVKSSLAKMVGLAEQGKVEALEAAQIRNQTASDDLAEFREKFLMSEL